MRFGSESEMKRYVGKRLLKDLKHIFTTTKKHILDEVPYGAGKTDLVVVNFSEKYLYRRIGNLGLHNAIERNLHLQIYLHLKELDEESIENIQTYFRSDRNQVISAITWLSVNGFVEKKGSKIKAKKVKKHVTACCAFELKLSDWKAALLQAHRAKSYSNIQFVVLDGKYIKPAIDNKEVFQSYNIGLISITPKSSCNVHFWPEKSQPFSPINIWRLNEYSFRLLKEKYVCQDN